MVRRETFINKIRELDYSYRRQQKRTSLWRQGGGTHRIALPANEMLEDEYVTSTLRQAGCSEDAIQAFLKSAKS